MPAGALLLKISGQDVRDSLDLMFQQADDELLLELELPDGQRLELDIEKDPDEPLGLLPEPDKIRRCTNACTFCFVKGNPTGGGKLRAGLYIKDDDYRLSFMYGHYVTLTNLRPDDWDRIFDQRLSPLYVSVHATDPEVRRFMLKNPRSALINEHLDRLADGGISVHAQIVLCPGLNDGPVLARTASNLYDRGDKLLSLSVVPVGLTSFNQERGGGELTAGQCLDALDVIEGVRKRALGERGRGWCYAADEMFLRAELAPPDPSYYDGSDLEANGVGSIAALLDRVNRQAGSLPRRDGQRIAVITGKSMHTAGPRLTRLLGDATGAEFRFVGMANSIFGPTVTTAGLLGAEDHMAGMEEAGDWDMALFSQQALNGQGRFIDDVPLEEVRGRFPGRRVEPSTDFIDILAGDVLADAA